MVVHVLRKVQHNHRKLLHQRTDLKPTAACKAAAMCAGQVQVCKLPAFLCIAYPGTTGYFAGPQSPLIVCRSLWHMPA
jgi:hypothetical protein